MPEDKPYIASCPYCTTTHTNDSFEAARTWLAGHLIASHTTDLASFAVAQLASRNVTHRLCSDGKPRK
jgi:hypothetical protein